MKKNIIMVFAFLMYWISVSGQVKPVKNVILMIPDGTSIGVVSAARWYKAYNGLGENLNIDPYFCGTVKTFSSNAPIGDSAPTGACYMTGVLQQSGNVAVYPPADPGNDLVFVDPERAYQPLATVMEAARILQNKATGIVVTVEFPHATPAGCASHHYSRKEYNDIATQMAYNNLDVMFGGGNNVLTEDIKEYFSISETTLIQNDPEAFRNYSGDNKIWALFGDMEHPYDLDRDPDQFPSLEEMTRKAISHLSKNDNGFFLMVEGSKIDWSAHSNDAVACITEFIAFDNAVGAAIEFAGKDGETAVVILPDHGNSGFTIGRADLENYTETSIHELFGSVSNYTKTAEGIEKILKEQAEGNYKNIVKEYTGIEITDAELEELIESKKYSYEDYTKAGREKNMIATLARIMNARTWFGFSSYGHTGEEVFLAAYHPEKDVPMGLKTNVEINRYLCDVLGLPETLESLTEKIFAGHTEVFEGLNYEITGNNNFPMLIVKDRGNILEIPAFKSVAYWNKQAIDLGSVTVYIDINNTFYLPAYLRTKFE